MLEAEGRKLASNPYAPLGLVRKWLEQLANLPKGNVPDDYRELKHLHRSIRTVAKTALEELLPYSDKTRIHTIKPTQRMKLTLKKACGSLDICFFSEHSTMTSFLNDLSALVHRYEAIAFSKRISKSVFASDDASEEFLKTALAWEKHLYTLHKLGLISPRPGELFAYVSNRLDLKIGLSPGHLTKINQHTTEYFDPDLDAVYSLGELHRTYGGRLMAKKGEHTFLFSNPSNLDRIWAVAVSQDRRNLLFRRLFHDVAKQRPPSLLRAFQLAGKIIRTYSPEFERRYLHTLLLEHEDVLNLCLEEIAYGVVLARKNPNEKQWIEHFSVGKAGGIASNLIILKVLQGKNQKSTATPNKETKTENRKEGVE